jgi:hypothetical protein
MPQFNERRMRDALDEADIAYVAIPQLAGRRGKSAQPSQQPCWRNRLSVCARIEAGHLTYELAPPSSRRRAT